MIKGHVPIPLAARVAQLDPHTYALVSSCASAGGSGNNLRELRFWTAWMDG